MFIFDWGISHISLLEVSGRKISSPKRSEPAGLETQSLVRPPGMAAALGCCRGLIAAVILSRLNMSRSFLLLIFLELQFSLSSSNALCVHQLEETSFDSLLLLPPLQGWGETLSRKGKAIEMPFQGVLFTATSACAFRYS